MTENPYITGPMIKDPPMFFGRTEKMARLHDAARKSSSIAIVGLRRIGKSSLLWQFVNHADLPAEIVPVYVDLHDARTRTISDLLTTIVTALDARLNRYEFGPISDQIAFTNAIEQIGRDGYQPIVCLDEMEKLMERDCFDRDFFEGWRHLASLSKLAFITASAARLEDIVKHDGETSPFTNIFTQVDLAGLDADAARRLLTEPFRRAGRPSPPAAHVENALTLAGRHPLFLQLAGSLLWAKGGQNQGWLRDEFAQAARKPLQTLWRALSPAEQAAAARLATGQGSVPNWQTAQIELQRTGLAEMDAAGKLRLFSPLLTEWLQDGTLTREPARRPVSSTHKQRPIQGEEKKPVLRMSRPTPPLYAYALVLSLVFLLTIFITVKLDGSVGTFFVVATVGLAFVLVGDNKLTGGQFLDWLGTLWQGLSGKQKKDDKNR
ncbi:MAG: AAA family ATPase [Chloroflexi bacterium]|nr:AAA family ATPase [Chloroflexota bacterium]